jgi:tRNA (adenine57-N1/adenine58-N1)-methyltransferase
VHQTSYGALKVQTLVGKEYGSKISLPKGYAFVLQMNPELWTCVLPHRTQILYTPDISMILMQLEIKSSSVVIEAGTGSGSLSHYFLRAVQGQGHLHTFDFHESRVDQAREEFHKHGFGDYVTVKHRDVCSDGFTDELTGKADAIFLDLPAPYKAIEHVVKALKPTGGRFCAFSPCIEQTQETCLQLEKYGFLEIQTVEVLQSEHIVREKNIPVMDLSFVKLKRDEGEAKIPKRDEKRPQLPTRKILTTMNTPMQQGHTGFLTFATFLSI